MKEWDGIVGKWLSGVAVMALVFIILVFQSTASTDVVWGEPQGNTNREITTV